MREIWIAILKTGSGLFFKLLFSAVRTKIIAMLLGPSGVGLYSVLNQAAQEAMTAATLGGSTALVQGLSSFQGDAKRSYVLTVAQIFAVGALVVAAGLVLLAPLVASLLFGRGGAAYTPLLRWLSVPVVLSAANVYAMGVLNGYRAIGRMALVEASGTLVSALAAYPLARSGHPGVFVALLGLTAAVNLAVSGCFALRAGWLNPLRTCFQKFGRKEDVKHFFSIARTMLATAVVGTGSILAVRAMFVHYGGLSAAGVFDAAWTFGVMYVMLALGSLATYYLPTLSSIRAAEPRAALIRSVFRVTTMLLIPLVTTAIIAKPLAVRLLYSEQFLPAVKILRWMLVGTYLQASTWVLAMPLLAYADMRVYFRLEISWRVALVTVAAVSLFVFRDPQGIGIGFVAIYAGALPYTLHYCRSRYGLTLPKRTVALWIIGFVIVLGASATYWRAMEFRIGPGVAWLGVAVVASLLMLQPSERRAARACIGGRH